MVEQRVNWIDALRGIGIFFVVFGHLNPNLFLETHIYSFHMFLFFFISGFLYTEKRDEMDLAYIGRKAKRLLIPFFFWNTAAVIVGFLLTPNQTVMQAISQLFYLQGSVSWNSPVWFFVVLFLTEAVYRLLSHINGKLRGAVILICLVLCLVFSIYRWRMPFGLNLLPASIFFYWLGHCFKEFNIRETWDKCSVLVKTGTLILCLGCNILFGIVWNVRISIYHGAFGAPFYTIIAGITGILFYMGIAGVCAGIKPLLYCGKNALPIMCIHYFIFNILDLVTNKLFGIEICQYRGTLKALVIALATISAILAVKWLLSKSKSRFSKGLIKSGII